MYIKDVIAIIPSSNAPKWGEDEVVFWMRWKRAWRASKIITIMLARLSKNRVILPQIPLAVRENLAGLASHSERSKLKKECRFAPSPDGTDFSLYRVFAGEGWGGGRHRIPCGLPHEWWARRVC
jgi:hypothetical protein